MDVQDLYRCKLDLERAFAEHRIFRDHLEYFNFCLRRRVRELEFRVRELEGCASSREPEPDPASISGLGEDWPDQSAPADDPVVDPAALAASGSLAAPISVGPAALPPAPDPVFAAVADELLDAELGVLPATSCVWPSDPVSAASVLCPPEAAFDVPCSSDSLTWVCPPHVSSLPFPRLR